jgi:hypothetical protein
LSTFHPWRFSSFCPGILNRQSFTHTPPFPWLLDPWAKYPTPDAAQAFLNVFRKAGYVELDTARTYSPHAPGTSEPLLGQTDFKDRAVMDTKIPYSLGSGTAENVAESVGLSLEGLGVSKVRLKGPLGSPRAALRRGGGLMLL